MVPMLGLKKPVAQDQQRECDEERRAVARGHREVTEGHEGAADDHRGALSEEAVGDETAEEGGHVHERGVRAVDRVGLVVAVVEEVLRHVEDEERAHPVVREALPHLREEQGEEPGVMAHAALEGRLRGLYRRLPIRADLCAAHRVPPTEGITPATPRPTSRDLACRGRASLRVDPREDGVPSRA
jgi:hypothetical protein